MVGKKKKKERPQFVMGFCADEAHGDWNMGNLSCNLRENWGLWASEVQTLAHLLSCVLFCNLGKFFPVFSNKILGSAMSPQPKTAKANN